MIVIQSGEPHHPTKHKVKDLSPEEKRAFLHRKYEELKDGFPEVDEMFERMRLSEKELQDEKMRYILGLE